MSIVLDPNNSTTTNLVAANAHGFTGARVDVAEYSAVQIHLFSTQAGTVYTEFSHDGFLWTSSTGHSYLASTLLHVTAHVEDVYFRARVVGAAANTTLFSLNSRLISNQLPENYLNSAEDSVTAHQGGSWSVTTQNFSHVTDSVTSRCLDGAGNSLVVAAGQLAVEDAAAAALLGTINASATAISTQLPAALGQAAAAASMSVVLASNQVALPVQEVGVEANLWNADVLVGAADSTAVDLRYCKAVTIMGQSSNSVTITLKYSQDNATWYSDGAQQSSLTSKDSRIKFRPVMVAQVGVFINQLTAAHHTMVRSAYPRGPPSSYA